MNWLTQLFRRETTVCPRCLGKGQVDEEDIRRLKMEAYWGSGKCAYCNGRGRVSPTHVQAIKPDLEYLTLDIAVEERRKLVEGDREALIRADEHRLFIQKLVSQIEHWYYIENRDPEDIAILIYRKQRILKFSDQEKQELVKYVEKVIQSKLEK